MGCCTEQGPAMMPLAQALDRLEGLYAPVEGEETVSLADACGRILATSISSPIDVPPVAVSAMDGWACIATDVAGDDAGQRRQLKVVGRVPAGAVFSGILQPGEAVRIFTGAPVPAGADAVAMQEDCIAGDDVVEVPCWLKRGENVRVQGDDIRCGAEILLAGQRLRPQEVGLVASIGLDRVTVRRRLRVVLFSTGNELREPGSDRPAGSIYDANRYVLAPQLRALGVELRDLGILPDDPAATRRALADAAVGADLLITSGGVSVGEEDHVKEVIQSLGSLDLWKLAVKPGKPVALGRIGDAVFLGLPGNPVSAMVTFLMIGQPLLARLAGERARLPVRTLAVADFHFRHKLGRQEFLRVRLGHGADGRPTASLFVNNSSGVLSSMVAADGLLDMPADMTEIKPGQLVEVLLFSGLLG